MTTVIRHTMKGFMALVLGASGFVFAHAMAKLIVGPETSLVFPVAAGALGFLGCMLLSQKLTPLPQAREPEGTPARGEQMAMQAGRITAHVLIATAIAGLSFLAAHGTLLIASLFMGPLNAGMVLAVSGTTALLAAARYLWKCS